MKRGDVYLADLDPTKGSEQAGRRPVLILQDDRLIPATLTVMVIPLTTNLSMQKLPTCVLIPQGEGGLRQDSIAICHQMRALDKQGLIERWGTVSPERLVEVERIMLRTLGHRKRITSRFPPGIPMPKAEVILLRALGVRS